MTEPDIQFSGEVEVTTFSLHAWLNDKADKLRQERLRLVKRYRLGTARQNEMRKEEWFYRHIADCIMTARRNDDAKVVDEIVRFVESRGGAESSLPGAIRKRFLLKGVSNAEVGSSSDQSAGEDGQG